MSTKSPAAADVIKQRKRAQLEFWAGEGPSLIFFPISEDSATLISPEQIRSFLTPAWNLAIRPFDTAFFHFCGYHPTLLDEICSRNDVSAVDLGNPESFDSLRVLETCACTNTVYYGRLAALDNENPESYLRRLARIVLRPVLAPDNPEEAANLLRFRHEATTSVTVSPGM